jgi:hypothetical protein
VATSWTFRSSDIVVDVSLDVSEHTLAQDLMADERYYWRVRAHNDAGFSDWADEWEFRAPVPPPNLVSPVDGGTTESPRPTFSWVEVADAHLYQIQVSSDIEFTNLVIEDDTWLLDYTPGVDLPAGATHYWRVRSSSFLGDFVDWWSPAWSCTTP